eukprot:CAMPEP_0175061592 /NCGR_PEP_ID=MMETSP0052_2-20121109/13666_1 /TAXON_ID=51329 ORGANISM="Polytomella parva, Strain SAG 63-3" /NCGR_SAMPLE_ID=MMETSP0052_2 /ASSEMBLY_ACC=CAM_ASM_000194 /LENGTH=70 /DNA_ID=CAMNT_0016327455 /DNA_START=93 /DNA_END=301 /DNA_ORIENTATION=+
MANNMANNNNPLAALQPLFLAQSIAAAAAANGGGLPGGVGFGFPNFMGLNANAFGVFPGPGMGRKGGQGG